MTENIEGYNVDIVWVWYWKEFTEEERQHGAYFISPGKFYIETRIEGKIVYKEETLQF